MWYFAGSFGVQWEWGTTGSEERRPSTDGMNITHDWTGN